MNKDILILTQMNANPSHARIAFEKLMLEELGYNVKIRYSQETKGKMTVLQKLKYWAYWSFFRWDIIQNIKEISQSYYAIIVYDLALLPAGKSLRNNTKKLIYETIDDNVSLTVYNVGKRSRLLGVVGDILKPFMYSYERKQLSKYFDMVIVNSAYLYDSFGMPDKVMINYYSSPFELLSKQSPLSFGLCPAILYLGKFSEEKGAADIVALSRKMHLPLIVFGDLEFRDIPDDAHIYPRMGLTEVYNAILELSKSYYFLGVSLIQSVNASYNYQEANKDIDYLALGIPIIGNKRPLTFQKIIDGCGVLYQEEEKIRMIMKSKDEYSKLSNTALQYYARHYSSEIFKSNLKKLIG